jgi:hypothetical protein
MNKLLFFFCMILIGTSLFADAPGNNDIKYYFHIKGISRLPENWILYEKREYYKPDEFVTISKDTTLIDSWSPGPPSYPTILAKNIKTGKFTPEISLESGYMHDILTIRNDSLIVKTYEIDSAPMEDQNAADLIIRKEENFSGTTKWLLIGVASASLTLLVWIYIRKKNQKKV